MLTGEDIQRCFDEHDNTPKQLVVIETMQFFEIEIPADIDPEDFIQTAECREICAEKITSQMTDLEVQAVAKTKDANGNWETP